MSPFSASFDAAWSDSAFGEFGIPVTLDGVAEVAGKPLVGIVKEFDESDEAGRRGGRTTNLTGRVRLRTADWVALGGHEGSVIGWEGEKTALVSNTPRLDRSTVILNLEHHR